MNLATKYRPKQFEDVVGQPIITEILDNICKADHLDSRNFLLIGNAGCGKAQPLDSRILTSTGFIYMRDVKVGTTVFTMEGKPAKVTGVFPQDGPRDIYKIILQDRTSIEVSDEHLNVIYTYNDQYKRKDYEVCTTLDLINKFKACNQYSAKLRVELPTIYFEHSDVEIDPYEFGCLLGKCVKLSEENWSSHINDYLFNDFEIRLNCLQGILDNNAVIQKDGSIKLSTSDRQKSEYIAILARSLGVRTTISEINYTMPMYVLFFHRPKGMQIVKNHKFMNRVREPQHNPTRNIVDIQYVGKKSCQCIYVDDESHTYISETGIIPTHNTTCARIMANRLNKGKSEPIEIDAASNSGVDSVREIIQQARSYPIDSNYKVFIIDECHSFSQQAWQVLLKTLEENPAKSVFIFATTNPEKIPATILSRVQTFQLSKINLEQIHDRLIYVLQQEIASGRTITYSDDAIYYIAKLAQGGMRDALTLLDKALAYDNTLDMTHISKALNLPEYDDYFCLLSAYVKKDNTSVAKILDKVYNSGINFAKWMENFHSFIINIVKYIYLQDINMTMIPSIYADRIANYGVKHSAICLILANKLVKLNNELKFTSYQQELALTYLCNIPKS